jgi:GT2 family glycosyltransferase
VAPKGVEEQLGLEQAGLFDVFVTDAGQGLASAINQGLKAQPSRIVYSTWLGDDDFLEPGSMEQVLVQFDDFPDCSAVFGRCNYVDARGTVLFNQRAGRLASRLLLVGPDLVPQPGSVIRKRSFEQIGYLDEKFGLAFDYDMFLKLRKVGRLGFVNVTLANFTWHDDSLSVRQRKQSVNEARLARSVNAKTTFEKSLLLLSPISSLAATLAGLVATWMAAKNVQRRVKS